MKILWRICGSTIIALSLAFSFWYFLLTGLPDSQVQGIAAPTMTREEILDLMNFHGTRVAYIKNGVWFFDRDGEAIPLKRKP